MKYVYCVGFQYNAIRHYVIKFVSNFGQIGGFSDTLVSSRNKTDRNDITEILLKVPLNTIRPKKITCVSANPTDPNILYLP